MKIGFVSLGCSKNLTDTERMLYLLAEKGYEITIPAATAPAVYVAGATLDGGALKTSGGRVLGVTAIADTLPEAIERAYGLVDTVHFGNAYYRKDIGKRAMEAYEK